MSQAQALLNTLNDVTAFADVEYADDRITVDTDRFIHVPDSMRRLGVQHDHNIETVTFVCPRFWDGIDMSEMCIYVNYLRPDGVKGRFLTTNLTVEDETMTFDWVISNNVTQVKGKLSFLICIVKTNEDGLEEQHWNSELNQECYISEGMECHDPIVLGYPDVITHILLQMEKLSSGSGSGSDTPDDTPTVPDTPVVSAVQSDYSQNDSTQPDYIKNRTHWEENNQVTIEWDGSTEGRDIADIAGGIVKVSDTIPDPSEVIGGILTIRADENEQSLVASEASLQSYDGLYGIFGIIWVAQRTDVVYEGESVVFPSTGMYIRMVENTYANQSITFTYGSNTIKTIDEKFIPDTIARVADLPEQKEITVNGIEPDENGNIEIKLNDSGDIGVFSWDELADKPFGDEYIELEWDGNTAGLETAFLSSTSAFYKISDIVLTAKDLVGGYCEITETNTYGGSASVSRQIIEDMIHDRDDRIYVQLGIPAGSNCLLVVKTPINDGAVTPGLYFASISLNNYVYHISRFSHIITNRIPEKFIPDTIARKSDIPAGGSGGVSSWNDLEDKPFYSEMVTIMEEQSITTVDNGGLYSYLFPEPLPLEVGCTIVVYYNGDKYEGVVKEAKAQGFLPFVYFGDIALQVGQQTEGEPPFMLLSTTVSNESMSGLFTPSVETCTIRVDLENVVRISDKYIPKQEIKHPLIGGAVGGISSTLSGYCTVLGARTIVRRIDNQLFDETGYLEASLLVVDGSLYVPFELGVKYAIFNVFSFPSKAQAETLYQSPTVWRLVMAADDEGVENFKSDYSISEWEDWV